MKKYGVKHNTELKWVLEKMKETGIRNKNYTPDESQSFKSIKNQ